MTRELFASSIKNRSAFRNGGEKLAYIGNSEYFSESAGVTTYTDPGEHQNHYLYLQGKWESGRESLTHARETSGYDDYVAIKFYSNDVNVVFGMNDSEYEVRVTLGDSSLARSQAGDDIRYDAEGNSYFVVDQARMFNIVRLDEFGTHELKISSNSDDFELFTFSFGHYQRTPRELAGITDWINTAPLALSDLRGKVVLVVFFIGRVRRLHPEPAIHRVMAAEVRRPWADGCRRSHTAIRVRETARCRHSLAGRPGNHARRRGRPRRGHLARLPQPFFDRHLSFGQSRVYSPRSVRAGWIHPDGAGD